MYIKYLLNTDYLLKQNAFDLVFLLLKKKSQFKSLAKVAILLRQEKT